MRNGKARLSRLLFVAFALGVAATPLAGQRADRRAVGGETQRSSPWTAFLAGSVAVAAIAEPFASNCLDRDGGGGFGVQASIGVRSAGGWDLRARYTGIREAFEPECVLVPAVMPDGVYRRRTYERELWGDGIRTLDLEAGFTPSPIPFLRIATGVGVEVDRGIPFLLGGAGLHLGSRVQLAAGADVLLFRTPYIIAEEEWRDSRLIRTSQVGEGEMWRRSLVFHLGVELPVRLP